MVVTESTVTTTPSATAKDIDAILSLQIDADTEQQNSAKRPKSTRVPVMSSQQLLKVTRSLESREERLLQKIASLMANGDPNKKRSCLETELEKIRSLLDKAVEEKELIAAPLGLRIMGR